MPNQKWEGNQVTAELEHFSVYLLLNKIAIEEFWNSALELPEAPEGSPKDIKRQIAFVLDNSGSMDSNDSKNIRGQLTKEFCSELTSSDSVSIYGFNNNINNFNSNTFISDKTDINNAVDKFINAGNGGGTYIANALNTVYKDLINEKIKFEEDSNNKNSILCQYVFLLTDGVAHDTPTTESLTAYRDASIKIFTVGFGEADHSYLKRISDLTEGTAYSSDSSSNLNDIFLKFNEEIDDRDDNGDKIPDYYAYLLCEGIITTRTGTKVFEGFTYDEIKENDDFDNDGLKNGEEVVVAETKSETNGTYKPYAYMSSDPTLIYTDHDYYSDKEEREYGTSPLTFNYLISQNDYHYLLNGSNFSFTKAANDYLNQNEGIIAGAYFIDVVLCGSESYFDTIKQGVQWCYLAATKAPSTIGSENLLMKENKDMLVEYLTKLYKEQDEAIKPGEVSEEEANLNFAGVTKIIDSTKSSIETIELLMGIAKKDGDYKLSKKAKDKLLDKQLKKLIEEEKSAIAKLQSENDLAKNEARRTGTYSRSKKAAINQQADEIAERQRKLYRGIFEDIKTSEIEKRYENNMKNLDRAFRGIQGIQACGEKIVEVIEYSRCLALLEQYREFLTELSQCNDEYVAVAAGEILKDLDSNLNSDYMNERGSDVIFWEVVDQVFQFGIDEVLNTLAEDSGTVLSVLQFITSSIAGENFSYERKNLISADLSTQIVDCVYDRINMICDKSVKTSDGNRYYIAEGVDNCLNAHKYMTYYLATRQFGEEKYVKLAEDETGLAGLADFNILKSKYGIDFITDAKINSTSLEVKRRKYERLVDAS